VCGGHGSNNGNFALNIDSFNHVSQTNTQIANVGGGVFSINPQLNVVGSLTQVGGNSSNIGNVLLV
jgi:hypothetical protein